MYYVGSIPCIESDIKHFGIPGMKWGQRRYQNEDGTLTEEGKRRYLNGNGSLKNRGFRMLKKDPDYQKLEKANRDIELYSKPKIEQNDEYQKLLQKRDKTASSIINKHFKKLPNSEERYKALLVLRSALNDFIRRSEVDTYSKLTRDILLGRVRPHGNYYI